MDRALLPALVALGVILALGAGEKDDGLPWLVLSGSPRITTGRSVVTFTLRLRGREDERFYCPAVEWTWSDGTRSLEEEDCPPWSERDEYRRVWSRRVLVMGAGDHRVTARLLKRGKVLMVADTTVIVAGGE